MAESSSTQDDTLIATSSSTSGLNILLHPLPLLNISEHCNRSRFSSSGDTKLIGALLGTQLNRDISIVNSFELVLLSPDAATTTGTRGEDVEMGAGGESSAAGAGASGIGEMGRYVLDTEFFETRKEQFKAVFPAQEVVGWYTIASGVSEDDSHLHQQLARTIDNPIFLLFDPNPEPTSQDLPIRVFESSLEDNALPDSTAKTRGKFVELEYGVESGEAERIAVDGVSRGGMGEGDENAVVGNLVTQRNAIRMLYERIAMIAEYIDAVSQKKVAPDHAILRQISSLVSTLPTIDAPEFRQELTTEYEDVQLTTYLANLTKQISALSSYADRHYAVHPNTSQFEGFGPAVQRGFKGGRRR